VTVEEYLGGIAQQLVHELEPILKVKEVTTNSDLLGSYTEAAVRRLTTRIVAPMRVSTGAIIDYPMPEKLRQLDVILWAPFPAAACEFLALRRMEIPHAFNAGRLSTVGNPMTNALQATCENACA
jgi:hypothetical protein